MLAKPARLPYSNFSREGAQRRSKLGLRLVVGQRILVPSTGVRLSQSQPFATSTHMARSSSGSGRRPLKAEITSSNLVRATMSSSGRPSKAPLHMARSSSGSGRRPLKAEITSSNLVRATTKTEVRGIISGLFSCCAGLCGPLWTQRGHNGEPFFAFGVFAGLRGEILAPNPVGHIWTQPALSRE